MTIDTIRLAIAMNNVTSSMDILLFVKIPTMMNRMNKAAYTEVNVIKNRMAKGAI